MSDLNQTLLLYRCRIPESAGVDELQRGLKQIPFRLHEDITRYKKVEDQLSRLVARCLVRKALMETGRSDLSDLSSWDKTPSGKPFLKNTNIDFSMSHSRGWIAVALGTGRMVGLDIECKIQKVDLVSIRRYLSVEERESLDRVTNPEPEALELWCMREAIMKADGRGLLAPDHVIRDIQKLTGSHGGKWWVQDFSDANVCLFLAMDNASAVCSVKDWDLKEILWS